MIYRAIILILQRFLWSKIRGNIKSKLLWIVGLVGGGILFAALFSMFFMNMTFSEGLSWAWGYASSSAIGIDRMFSSLFYEWMRKM
jgi:hypothetical protein